MVDIVTRTLRMTAPGRSLSLRHTAMDDRKGRCSDAELAPIFPSGDVFEHGAAVAARRRHPSEGDRHA